MAKVIIEELRQQEAHYGLYRTALGGDERVIVRRKMGERTDYDHNKSKPVRRQRDRLTAASHHWNALSPSQKNDWRNTIGFVERSGRESEDALIKRRVL